VRRTLVAALTAALAVALMPVAPAAGADVVHPIVFPVVGDVTWSDTWHAPRGGGRLHMGQDLMGSKGQPLVAADAGTITFLQKDHASAGHWLRLLADDGWIYTYIHLNNDTPGTDDGKATDDQIFGPGIAQGVRVDAGQVVGYMGDSGNAESTAPHLHFEMKDPSGTTINPAPSLREAVRVDGSAGAAASPIPRIAGIDRVATAVEAARAGWPQGAGSAVLAAGARYDESLPAGVLAAARQGPLLLTTASRLEANVAEVLRQLGVGAVTVVGSVPAQVEADLRSAGHRVDRLGVAGNPVETAAAVAGAVGGQAGTVVLVNGSSFADGISAAGLAAGRGWPVLLTTASTVPQRSVDTWRALGVRRVVLVGGTAVIGDNIQRFIASSGRCAGGAGCEVERVAGTERYGTSVQAASRSIALGGRSAADLLVGTGTAFPDALTAGPLTARRQGITVLVDGSGAGRDGASRAFLSERRAEVERVAILGGSAAVGSLADRAVQQALGIG
jgi:putative cell wall-binding protein